MEKIVKDGLTRSDERWGAGTPASLLPRECVCVYTHTCSFSLRGAEVKVQHCPGPRGVASWAVFCPGHGVGAGELSLP